MGERGFLVPMEEEGRTDPESQIIFQAARNPSFQLLFRVLGNRTLKHSRFPASSSRSTWFANWHHATALPLHLAPQ